MPNLVSIFYDYDSYPGMNKLGVVLHEGQMYNGEKRKFYGAKIEKIYQRIMNKKFLRKRSSGGKFPRGKK